MKTAHEQRIEIVTGVDTDRASHVPRYTPRTSAATIRGSKFSDRLYLGCATLTLQRRHTLRSASIANLQEILEARS